MTPTGLFDGDFYPEMAAAYAAAKGLPPEKIQPTPIGVLEVVCLQWQCPVHRLTLWEAAFVRG